MIIAVSMRETVAPEYPEKRDAISHDWVYLLDSLGVTPVLIPNVLADAAGYLRAIDASGVLLTGGEDLGPLPGEVTDQPAGAERDQTEHAVLGYALEQCLPVFGVCRGLQLINVHFGGGLVRDLSALGNHASAIHSVRLLTDPTGGFGELGRVDTNSYHGQGVVLGGLGRNLEAFALADNDVVEGLVHRRAPVTAVQWHPERPNSATVLDRSLLKDWLARCA